MAVIDDLLEEVPEASLRTRLMAEVARLREGATFGIVFERHVPEFLAVPGTPLRLGTRVAVRGGPLTDTLTLVRVGGGTALCRRDFDGAEVSHPLVNLVAVKRFGEPVFPALHHVESVLHGGDAPHHALVEGENHSVLQLLSWMLKGRVDCIYIDPPYNTGATSWMYNNRIVDGNDAYRSSKWLSMMERRLLLAQPLLKEDGVLVVTIDENELATLRMLLDKPGLFRGWDTHIVTIVHNPRGIQGDNFSVTNEFAVFLTRKGNKAVERRRLRPGEELSQPLRKWGDESERHTAANCFYPIRFRDGAFHDAGPVLPSGTAPPGRVVELPGGVTEFWPIDGNGVERKWRYARDSVEEIAESLVVEERRSGPDVFLVNDTAAQKTVWLDSRYAAFSHGTQLVKRITGTKFPFPKSVYATHDCIEAVVRNRPDAIVLDFFGGSGTTMHAVAMMNAVDGGRRRCITVTNNEVGGAEERRLRRDGRLPGDAEWEEKGICRSVTFPRMRNVITGRHNNGSPLRGEWMTGRFEEREVRPKLIPFHGLGTLPGDTMPATLAASFGIPARPLKEGKGFSIGGGTALLLDTSRLRAFLGALQDAVGNGGEPILKVVYAEPSSRAEASRIKAALLEGMPVQRRAVEVTRPLSDGLAANLSYFRLAYLDPDAVEVGARLNELLPTLWFMGGCCGAVSAEAADQDFLIPEDSHFALLVRPAAFRRFRAALDARPDVRWVFIVEDSPEGFLEMGAMLPGHVPIEQRVRLFRAYLDNFNINRGDL